MRDHEKQICKNSRRQNGNILLFVIMMLIISAIAAYGALYFAISAAHRGVFYRERTRNHYAAQAGLVWAMEQLWNNPLWSAPLGVLVPGGIGGVPVTVTMPDCGVVSPCPPRQITVTVPD